jgi:hypothetical protein
MPQLDTWFSSSVTLPWEISEESPWNEKKGKPFKTFPLSWLVPYSNPRIEDLRDTSTPIWITEIHPSNPLGTLVEDQEGTFIIDLPSSIDFYFESLEPKDRKKFSDNLKKNSTLSVVEQSVADIDALWGSYVDRLQVLAKKAGGDIYSEEEIEWRHRFLHQESIRAISFYEENTLLAVNIALVKNDIVYDLACIINQVPSALKRSLGTTAILKNIEWSIRNGYKTYDLLSRDYGYKRQFGAKEVKLKAVIIGDDDFFDEYSISKDLRWNPQSS